MTDGNKISRRDWFRLRPSRVESSPLAEHTANDLPIESPIVAEHSMGETRNGLQPIAHPENHDGMNLAELPPMREALLSEDQVRQLFSDIEALASDVLMMQRSASSQRATAATSKTTTVEQLRAAQDTLLSGAVPRLQIRYHWQAANWIDTLERRDDGVRLIRITHDPAAFANRASTNS